MDQDTMLEKIRRSAENVPTPKALEPGEMMKAAKAKSSGPRRRIYGGAAAAAVVAISVVAYSQLRQSGLLELWTSRMGEAAAGSAAPAQEAMQAPAVADQVMTEQMAADQYTAKNYEEIYKQIQALAQAQVPEAMTEAAELSRSGAAKKDEGAILNASAYGTEELTASEPDVVKSDGTYLYIVSQHKDSVAIIETEGAAIAECGVARPTVIGQEMRPRIREVFALENRLMIISDRPNEQGGEETLLETFDTSDKAKPVSVGRMVQDGGYEDSRMKDGIVYLYTEYRADLSASQEEKGAYIPKINGGLLNYEDIYIPDVVDQYDYLVISSVNPGAPDRTLDQKAVLAGSQQFYIGESHIYAGNSKYDDKEHRYAYTELLRLSCEEGAIGYQGHAVIDGYLDNRYSMDEQDGYLRLIGTYTDSNDKTVNSLYVLDETMAVVGSIGNLAPGEQIHSARFLGDDGYFTTYNSAKPVIHVDLSDPAAPSAVGSMGADELSDLLYLLEEDTFLHVFKVVRVDGSEGENSTQNLGLGLAIQNSSDPVQAIGRGKMLESQYRYSDAWHNHKSVMVSEEHGLIGFSVSTSEDGSEPGSQRYVVYAYDRNGSFTRRLEYVFDDGNVYATRGFCIGEYLYVAGPQGVVSFSLGDFTPAGRLDL